MTIIVSFHSVFITLENSNYILWLYINSISRPSDNTRYRFLIHMIAELKRRKLVSWYEFQQRAHHITFHLFHFTFSFIAGHTLSTLAHPVGYHLFSILCMSAFFSHSVCLGLKIFYNKVCMFSHILVISSAHFVLISFLVLNV